MQVDIKLEGLDKVIKNLNDIEKKHLPFVLSKTINNVAQKIKKAEVEEMKSVFDRPTPWVLNGLYIQSSTKTNLSAEVFFKDRSAMAKGTPLSELIKPQVHGGTREFKRSERLLGNKYWVPGAKVRLNKYGNVSGGQITQVLSVLKRSVDPYQNITARSMKRNKKPRNYFMIRNKSRNLRPGIWERTSKGHVKPILMFVRRPGYRARLNFYGIGRRIAVEQMVTTFHQNMREAIR
jgi:hypothetical protein